jgi:methylmalonyl-CoA/ethylmalonyl-CoA epimerase
MSLLDITEWSDEFCDKINNVYIQFGKDKSGMCIELVAPISQTSPVSHALNSEINILNHLAYLVEDLDFSAAELLKKGCEPLGEPKPAIAYQMQRIQFFYTPLNYILELIEAPHHLHSYRAVR